MNRGSLSFSLKQSQRVHRQARRLSEKGAFEPIATANSAFLRKDSCLLAAFDRVVAQGTAEFVLVSGYSGVGKSSVVNELHKVLVQPRRLFASGKWCC